MKDAGCLLLALLLVLSICTTVGGQTADFTTTLNIVAGKPVVDGVFLNGSGPYRFLIDTGSQTNHVDLALARKLNLAATLSLELDTVAGSSTVRGGRIDTVALGPLQAEHQEFLFTALGSLPNLPRGISGILGQEFLSHFDYTLDFRHHRFLSGGPAPTGPSTAVRLIYGRMAVPTNLGDLVLDSGAELLSLFRQPTSQPNARVTGTSGASTLASLEAAPDLRIGDRHFRPDRAEYFPVPHAEEAGLLPANLFQAIYICNSQHYVVFNPTP